METATENKGSLTPAPLPKGEGGSNLKGTKQIKPIDKAALVSLSFELGYIIAIPLVVLGLLGKWGDNHWQHSFPWMTLSGIGLAIVSTTVWLTLKLRQYYK